MKSFFLKTLGHLSFTDMMLPCIQSQTKFFIMKSNEELQKKRCRCHQLEPLLKAAEVGPGK
jgi:hypothetical protein